ncbi:MAG: DNA-processing protein DprA [Planctomycetota bacterium]
MDVDPDLDPYLLLAVAEGCGPGLVAGLLDPHQDPTQALADPPPLPARVGTRLQNTRGLQCTARRWLAQARTLRLSVLTPAHDAYPQRLRHMPLRPLVLFAKGNLELLNTQAPTLTIVGSRTPTPYGVAAAMDFATTAAAAGVHIWSGLALGIDGISHQMAVREHAPTLAVLAGGLDHVYPTRNQPLAEQIVAGGGLLLTEMPPGQRAHRGHFPRRNRILAGGARGVLVVEAGQCSGSLHTARFAAEVGVPVFCVPGAYTSPRSRGCHDLIADGAQVAACPDELLRRLGIEAGDAPGMQDSADEAAILRILVSGPRPGDLVQREAGLARPRYLAAVLSLARRRRVVHLPGDLLALSRQTPRSTPASPAPTRWSTPPT